MFSLKKFTKNASIVGISVMLSRVAGYGREIILASWMGTSAATDALIVATRIPMLLRKISTEGSLNAILIPLIDDIKSERRQEILSILVSKIMLIFGSILTVLLILQVYFAKETLIVLNPGTLTSPDRLFWFLKFIPFMSGTVLFYFFSGIFTAMLNANNKFFWPAIAPAVWNLFLIVSMLIAQYFEFDFTVLGPIFLAASFVQAFVVFISYIKLKLKFNIKKDNDADNVLKVFFKNLLPGIFSTSITQINSVILIALTSFLAEGNTTILHRADRLLQIPIAMILSINTILLPALSKSIEKTDRTKIMKISLLVSMFIFIPVSIIFYFFSVEICVIVFERGNCLLKDVLKIAKLLKVYAFGIPAFLLIRILPTFFLAQKEVKITAAGALIQTIMNICLSFLFIENYGIMGFAYASIISSWVNVAFLFINIFRKRYFFN